MQKTSVLEEICGNSLPILSICQCFYKKCKNGLKISNTAVILHIYECKISLYRLRPNWKQTSKSLTDYFDLRPIKKKDVTLCCKKQPKETAEHFWLHVLGIPGIQQDAPRPSGYSWTKVGSEVARGHLFRRGEQTHPWSEDHKTPGILGAFWELEGLLLHLNKQTDKGMITTLLSA